MPGTRRTFLKEKEARTLLSQTSEKLKASIEQLIKAKANVEQVETEHMTIYLINAKPLLAKIEGELVPTLVFSEYFAVAPKVVVDMGAVPYVCKGANVMRPGIRRFEGDFEKGDFVVVVDERHGKPLAVVEALCGRKEAEKATQGAMARNAHFVGDKLWDSLKRLTA
jgi:PUA-domain protein